MKSSNGIPVHLMLAAYILYFGWLLMIKLGTLLDRAISSLQP